MVSNNDQLREFIKLHNLSRARAAALCGSSLATLHAYLRPRSNHGWRNMPDAKLDLLKLRLAALAETKPAAAPAAE